MVKNKSTSGCVLPQHAVLGNGCFQKPKGPRQEAGKTHLVSVRVGCCFDGAWWVRKVFCLIFYYINGLKIFI